MPSSGRASVQTTPRLHRSGILIYNFSMPGSRDPRVDAFIKNARPFARPILRELRAIVHEACPDVEETLKWGMPHFMYRGMMCGMGTFKEHCSFGFWDAEGVFQDPKRKPAEGAGHFGKLRTLEDLPPRKRLLALVRRARKLNEASPAKAKSRASRPKAPRKPAQDTPPPPYLLKALRASPKALATFQAFSPSARREYIEWIVDAKTDETRERRMETAIDWMSEGRKRNWKYQKK